MLANETPVCVTIRDCCTAGFDVHLQASTIHPSLSLSLYPILLLLPAFYFLPSHSLLRLSSLIPSVRRESRKEKEKAKRFG